MKLLPCLAAAILLAATAAAHAQATRTWVSGVGDDVNPCSRTAPCKTWAGAISKTATGGEIDALDPGGFGAVTITKSITLDGGSAFGSILNASVNGIIVTSASPVKVLLRNLSLQGAGSGLSGIRFIGNGELHVHNVRIHGTGAGAGHGIDVVPNGATDVSIRDVQITGCVATTAAGISLNGTGGAIRAQLDEVQVSDCATGLRVLDATSVAVRRGDFSHGTKGLDAVTLASPVKPATINIDGSLFSDNATGLNLDGANTTVTLSDSTALGDNATVCTLANGAKLRSYGNNRLATSCTPTNNPALR